MFRLTSMTETARFPDWSSLSEKNRAAAAGACGDLSESIGRRLNAVVHLTPRHCGKGVLAGIPYFVKDMIPTGCVDPTWGCTQPVVRNAPVSEIVKRLERAGAVLIGIAEMTQLAFEPSGINAVRGSVLNPWNFDRVPGGSSSGSAALVASGCCFAALGSDTGGSVRIPAHCCGVTGLKPTWGKVPTGGTMALAPNLDTIGFLTRSAADAALLWAALFNEALPRHTGTLSGSVLADALGESDQEIAHTCLAAMDVLGRHGVSLANCAGFPQEADANCLLVMQAEAARTHRARLTDARMDAALRKRLGKGLAIGDADLAAGLKAQACLRAKFLAEQFGKSDVVLLPVMPIATPRVAEVDPASPEFEARTLYALSRFTRFVNYLGLPALAVPAGYDSRGMPIGLQIVGRPGDDANVISIGMILQANTDWHARVPTAIAAQMSDETQ
jgi:aspartyl-tRNA(Asn)/glutamyl-tRNA(Gln) amidotransferase subunit A